MPQPCGWGSISFTFIFFPGSHASADVSLLFVLIQNLPYLVIQSWIVFWKSVLQILMYRGFGDLKMLRRRSDGGAGLNDVHSQFAGSFFK